MTSTIVSTLVAVALSQSGWWWNHPVLPGRNGPVNPPGPGYGWGFPNGNPDGYGWWDHGYNLPLGYTADRTAEYYFPRYLAVPPEQLWFPTYYNPYAMRGQRYIPYAGAGGCHPMGGPPPGSAMTPEHPYLDTIGAGPQVPIPSFTGRVEAPPINSGGTGLTP
jgi:hypothetical protein